MPLTPIHLRNLQSTWSLMLYRVDRWKLATWSVISWFDFLWNTDSCPCIELESHFHPASKLHHNKQRELWSSLRREANWVRWDLRFPFDHPKSQANKLSFQVQFCFVCSSFKEWQRESSIRKILLLSSRARTYLFQCLHAHTAMGRFRQDTWLLGLCCEWPSCKLIGHSTELSVDKSTG